MLSGRQRLVRRLTADADACAHRFVFSRTMRWSATALRCVWWRRRVGFAPEFGGARLRFAFDACAFGAVFDAR